MRIDLNRKVFTTPEVEFIVAKLEQALDLGFVVRRTENNPYLLSSFRGVEDRGISHKWNVKLYKYSIRKNGHSLVCVDKYVLRKLVEEDYQSFVPPDLKVLRIDDAGWGFPLCGVMVGVSDEEQVRVAVVPVGYFRDDTRYNSWVLAALGLVNGSGEGVLEIRRRWVTIPSACCASISNANLPSPVL